MNIAVKYFKGSNVGLKGKVFVKESTQVSKYDETYKALIIYFGQKYDHRVYTAFGHRDADVGRNGIVKPNPPMGKQWFRYPRYEIIVK